MVVISILFFMSFAALSWMANFEIKRIRLQKELIKSQKELITELEKNLLKSNADNEYLFKACNKYFEGLYRLDKAVEGFNDGTLKLFEDTPFYHFSMDRQLDKEIKQALDGGH